VPEPFSLRIAGEHVHADENAPQASGIPRSEGDPQREAGRTGLGDDRLDGTPVHTRFDRPDRVVPAQAQRDEALDLVLLGSDDLVARDRVTSGLAFPVLARTPTCAEGWPPLPNVHKVVGRVRVRQPRPQEAGRMEPNPNKALWEKGDFTRIAASMRESGDALVEDIGVRPGMKVLDLGCGDGTTALPSARRGADVLGVDIARNLVEAGNRRAEAEGLDNVRFQEGDATNLEDLDDDSFDLTMSIFGAMFAPRPFDVAKEMLRVTQPGGRVIMGNWIPNDPTVVAQLLKISTAYSPPPPEGFVSPMMWGIESDVTERFTAAGADPESISFLRDTFRFDYPGSPAEFVAEFRDYYGPTMNAFDAAGANGRTAELEQELVALYEEKNEASDGSTSVPATFLRVTVDV
jgi:ubiquinone/menaquinone biosynthesis C-methylase UbiE